MNSKPLYINGLFGAFAAALLTVVLFGQNVPSATPIYLGAIIGGTAIALLFLRFPRQTSTLSFIGAASLIPLGVLFGMFVKIVGFSYEGRTTDLSGTSFFVGLLLYQPIQIYLVLITAAAFITMYLFRMSKPKPTKS